LSTQQLTATIPFEKTAARLDAVLAELFSDFSRNRIQDWVKSGKVTLDGEKVVKPNYKVLGGEEVILLAEIEAEITYQPQQIPLDIV